MKTRLRGNSIRIRLSKTEVTALGEGALISDVLNFPMGNSLCWQLTTGDDFKVSFDDEAITINLPSTVVIDWVKSDELSLSHDFPLEGTDTLWLLVEKDLKCKTERPREDNSDTFQNPNLDNC